MDTIGVVSTTTPTRPEGAKHVPKHAPSTRKKGFFRRFWWVFVLVPLLVVVGSVGSLYMAYARIQLPETLPPIRTSYLYDRNGVRSRRCTAPSTARSSG